VLVCFSKRVVIIFSQQGSKFSKLCPYKIKAIQLLHSETSAVLHVVVMNQESMDFYAWNSKSFFMDEARFILNRNVKSQHNMVVV
jgi:hypothetical protein